MNTPILLFAFRRPNHTRQVLESLAANPESKDARLFVFIDGPRHDSDPPLIAEVERVVRAGAWCGSIEVVRRQENWGVPRSMIATVGEFTDRFGTAIVLEDDILLSRFFLGFMQEALHRYRDDDRVMEVSGYRYPVSGVAPRSGFSAHAIGWGWATWKRAWAHFDPDGGKLLAAIEDSPALAGRFDLENSYPYLDMLRDQVAGKIGGWDVRWYASMLLHGGLALYPGVSLTANIGLDGSGTNCIVTGDYATELATTPIRDFPERVEEDVEFRQALRRFFLRLRGTLPTRLLRRVKRALPIPTRETIRAR